MTAKNEYQETFKRLLENSRIDSIVNMKQNSDANFYFYIKASRIKDSLVAYHPSSAHGYTSVLYGSKWIGPLRSTQPISRNDLPRMLIDSSIKNYMDIIFYKTYPEYRFKVEKHIFCPKAHNLEEINIWLDLNGNEKRH